MRLPDRQYQFAAAYSLAASALGIFFLHPVPPRYMDIYLIGIMFSTWRWSWRPAAVIFVMSTIVANWVLPVYSSDATSGGANAYRMLSYSVTCAIAVEIIDRAKRKHR